MEDPIVKFVVSSSENAATRANIPGFLSKQPEDTILQSIRSGALSQLNAENHRLAYLFLLKLVLEKEVLRDEEVLPSVEKFLIRSDHDSSLQEYGKYLYLVCEKYVELKKPDPKSIVMLLRKLDSHRKHIYGDQYVFTPLHTIQIHCALLTENFDTLVTLMNAKYLHFKKEYGVSYRLVLEFYYWGALGFLAHRMFERARDAFAIVVSYPGSRESKIQSDAYKKFHLLSLLLMGNKAEPPRSRQRQSGRFSGSRTYLAEFSNLYMKRDCKGLAREWDNIKQTLANDGNEQLARECLDTVFLHALTDALKDSSAMTLEDILSDMNLEATPDAKRNLARNVERAVNNGSLKVSLEDVDGRTWVTETSSESGQQAYVKQQKLQLSQTVQELASLNTEIEELNAHMTKEAEKSQSKHSRPQHRDGQHNHVGGKRSHNTTVRS